MGSMRRVEIEVLTNAAGTFQQDYPGWNGWYIYCVEWRTVAPAPETIGINFNIQDPDQNQNAVAIIGTNANPLPNNDSILPVVEPNKPDGTPDTAQAPTRSLKIYDRFRVHITAAGANRRMLLDVFLSQDSW